MEINIFKFYRENNDFTDILSDSVLKKYYRVKIRFGKHLIIHLNSKADSDISSIMILKYGESLLKESFTKDFAPVLGVEYQDTVPQHLKDQRKDQRKHKENK